MKWSEQMRVLLSEDEHYNQLKLDIEAENLFINEEFVAEALRTAVSNLGTSSAFVVKAEDYNKIIKKYPFFTDIKFLLNCIFKESMHFTKVSQIFYYDDYIVIQNFDSTRTLIIYTAPQVTP